MYIEVKFSDINFIYLKHKLQLKGNFSQNNQDIPDFSLAES